MWYRSFVGPNLSFAVGGTSFNAKLKFFHKFLIKFDITGFMVTL